MSGPRLLRAAALLALSACLPRSARAGGPGVDRFRLVNSACPVDVSEECADRCRGGSTGRACRWPDFGCDFKVCWGTRHHTVWEDLMAALTDPSSYRVTESAPYGGENFISLVRLIQADLPGLFMLRGEFILEMPALARPAQALRLLRWAQACAMSAAASQMDQIEASARSDTVFRVTSCRDRVYFARVSGLTGERPPAARADPPPSSRPPPSASPAPGVTDLTREVERIRGLPDADLERYLEGSGPITVDGGRILVDGIVPFSPHTDPEEQSRALSRLTDEQRVGLKEMHGRLAREAVEAAQRRSPAPEGSTYLYDPDTGTAELVELPEDGFIKRPY